MDYESVSAADFGRSLRGIGINLLTRDVLGLAQFLADVFGTTTHRASADFAIITYGDQVFQLHGDQTYHSNPLPSLLPEAGARGAGLEIHLFDTDPDDAARLAAEHTHRATILQPPTDKAHGLRECIILSEEGYAWLASRPLSEKESADLAAG